MRPLTRFERVNIIIAGILLISLFLLFNYFFVVRYASFPWWYFKGGDGDQMFPAQAVTAVNNGDIIFLMHPAATLYSLNGSTYRFLAAGHSSYKKLVFIRKINGAQDAFDVMRTTVDTARILSLIESLALMVLLYLLIYSLTRHLLLTFLFSFYIATSPGYLIHSTMVRMETLSLLFILGAIFFYLRKIQRRSQCSFLTFLVIGFLVGFAIFSKVQVGPIVLVFLVAIFLACLTDPAKYSDLSECASAKKNIVLAVFNILLAPWWAFRKPKYLTPAYLESLPQWRASTYGNAQDYYYVVILGGLAVLLLISILTFYLSQRKSTPERVRMFFPCPLILNLIIAGALFSTYIVFAPISMSFEKYIANTQNLVYSLLATISGSPYLSNPISPSEAIRQIFDLHNRASGIFNSHLVYLVVLVVLLCLLRLFTKSIINKKDYGSVLFFLIAGLFMDFFSAFRTYTWYQLQNSVQMIYAIYSICLYGIGIATVLSLEFRREYQKRSARLISLVFQCLIVLILSAHVLNKYFELVQSRKQALVIRKSPIEGNMYFMSFSEILKEQLQNVH
jgi:hypothetical protein